MVGTKAGGIKTAVTNKTKHGDDFYIRIGQKGGRNSNTGGFAANRELARKAGAKGGRKSKRGKNYDAKWAEVREQVLAMLNVGYTYKVIASSVGIPYHTLYYKIRKELKNELNQSR